MINQNFLSKISYIFQDLNLLKSALTHPSTNPSQKISEFERLEFLGDRVLGLAVAQMIYEKYPMENEGDLAKRFAALVCREACLEVAQKVELGEYLTTSLKDSSPNPTIWADTVEALIGAIYLDGGMDGAMAFINTYWPALLEKDIRPPKDAKTSLQELAQSKYAGAIPVYETLEHSGPAHTPTFIVRVSVKGLGEAIGTGASKRQAEQMAAGILLNEKK
ncbi:MAG: ribonuclease III [Alphaproteobacteria bacterium]|nr:ribonuclease III [Alphaproteobacteria bacterium]